MPRLSKIGAAALAAFGWTGLQSVDASYLVVAGGGGGGVNYLLMLVVAEAVRVDIEQAQHL
jgi:hypothetical protein